jgi:ribose transport system substrate-binding protein
MSGWRTLSVAILGPVAALALLASQALADESPTPEQQAAALANVPKDAQQYYQGYWYSTKLVADPLANWQPHKAPWQICHNDSYLGNSWRANLVAELQELTSQLAKQGLAKDKLVVTNSNGDINLELTQLKTQIAQGCDLVMMYPGSRRASAPVSATPSTRASSSSRSMPRSIVLKLSTSRAIPTSTPSCRATGS